MAIDVLTFAHFAEAESFINGLNLSLEVNVSNIYTSDERWLLITGQGMDNVRGSLNKLLSRHLDNVNRLFNFGIVGKLDQELSFDEVYPIKSVSIPDGKSFTINRDRGITCVSSVRMISDEKTAWEMAQLGQVVDMELFAVAEIASEYDIHLSAYKIISDDASKEPDLDKIKANSSHYSQTLYKYYLKNYSSK